MNKQPPRYVDEEQVRKVLTWPMAITAVDEALRSMSANADLDLKNLHAPFVNQPPRTTTKCGQTQDELLFTMPGYVANYHPTDARGDLSTRRVCTLACKLVTLFPRNEQQQPPQPKVLANILIFCTATGRLKCIMEATHITAWRTAAASIVATKLLYFRRALRENQQNHYMHFQTSRITVAIIGCGAQGESHALGMCATFKVKHIYLWNRTAAKAEALAELLHSAAPKTRPIVAYSIADAVVDADVICMCIGTSAAEPLLRKAMLRKKNVHINAVGAGNSDFDEIAYDIYEVSNIFVECKKSAKRELTALNRPIRCEVGSILRSDVHGWPPPPDGITIFQSLGIAAEDAAVAHAVYEAIETELPFLQP